MTAALMIVGIVTTLVACVTFPEDENAHWMRAVISALSLIIAISCIVALGAS